MADAFVQVATDGTGKQLQTHSNTVNAQTVHAQAVVPVDTAGVAMARPQTATATSVAGSASSVQLVAANAARDGLMIRNDSTADLYLGFGVAATTAMAVKLGPGAYWEMRIPCYTGAINGIWSAANGNARILELV